MNDTITIPLRVTPHQGRKLKWLLADCEVSSDDGVFTVDITGTRFEGWVTDYCLSVIAKAMRRKVRAEKRKFWKGFR